MTHSDRQDRRRPRNLHRPLSPMPYNPWLADAVRAQLGERRDIQEKAMFGGLGFLLRGNMCVGVWRDQLILRLGEDRAVQALKDPVVRPFDITGRPMKGWVMIEAAEVEQSAKLASWVEACLQFAAALPARTTSAAKAKRSSLKSAKPKSSRPTHKKATKRSG